MNLRTMRRHYFRRTLMALLAMLAFFSGRTSLFAASHSPRLMIIIDNSSSMEDQLAGELKYKLVRRSLNKALSPHGGKIEAGLIVFGRRSQNSCKDIQQPVPLKTLDASAFSLSLEALKPRGKSPIAAALALAATTASIQTNPLDMLLIADGGDNCRADLCATAERIASHSPATRIHVIGLGKSATVKKLSCLSSATNGLFSIALDRAEMTTAVERLLQNLSSPPVEQQSQTIAAPLPPMPVRRPPHKNAVPKKAAAPSQKVEPTRQDKVAKDTGTTVASPAAAPALPSGSQKAAATPQADATGRNETGKNAPALPALPLAPLPQNIKLPPEAEVPATGDIATKTAEKTTEKTAGQPPAPGLPSPPRQVPAETFTGNKSAMKVTLPPSSAEVKLAALITEEGKEVGEGLIWRIYDSRKDKAGRYRLVKTVRAPHFEGKLPLGVYLVNLSWGRSHLTEKMDILSSKPFSHKFVLNAGGLRLGARHMDGTALPPREVVYQIYSDERDQFGKRRLLIDNAQPGRIIRLNAGIYHVSSRYGTANGIIATDITIEAGKLTDAVINHTASKVTFKLVNRPGGEALAGTIWRIKTPDGKLVKEVGGALPTIILAAGDYNILAEHSGRTFARKVNIEPGTPIHMEIVIQQD